MTNIGASCFGRLYATILWPCKRTPIHIITVGIISVWNIKVRVLPVIIGATGTISKSFRKYVSDIPGNHDVKELQKTAILGTAHILRKVLT